MLVDVGLNKIRDFLAGETITAPTHLGIGTGTTSAAATDTALESEVFPNAGNRNALDSIDSSVSKKITFEGTINALQANNNTLAEMGLHNSQSGETMFNRVTFPGQDKNNTIEMLFQVTINLADGG